MPSEQFTNLASMFKMQRGATPPAPPTPPDMRTGYDMIGQMMPPVDGVDRTSGDIGGVSVTRFSPADATGTILYFHGGGYAIGSSTSHAPLAAKIAHASGAEVVFAEYRLAPEHPFPAGIDDAIAVYTGLLAETDASKIAIGGDSAGGGMTLALLTTARAQGLASAACAFLISPWCDMAELGSPSEEALDTDFLRPETLEQFAEWYGAPDRTDPRCSPIRGDLSGLPPLLIEVGEAEILCDQGVRLARVAKDAGVDVTLDVEPHMFHHWPVFTSLPEADETIAKIASFVRSKLS